MHPVLASDGMHLPQQYPRGHKSPRAQPCCGSSMWSPSVRRPLLLNSASVRVIVSRLEPRSWEMSSWVSDRSMRTIPWATCPSADDSNKNSASLPKSSGPPNRVHEITCVPIISADMPSRLQTSTALLFENQTEAFSTSSTHEIQLAWLHRLHH
jgi:hypothetical protein